MTATESAEDTMHFRNGLPPEAADDAKVAFAVPCLANYRRHECKPGLLSELFVEDICNFSE